MTLEKLYMSDEMLAMRQRAIAVCSIARASATMKMSDSPSGLKDIVTGKDLQLHNAYAEDMAGYVFEMHRRAWDTFAGAEIGDVDCLGDMRREEKSPYRKYLSVKAYTGSDLHGEIVVPSKALINRGYELLGEKMYWKELIIIIEQIAQDDTIAYGIAQQALAENERALMKLHLDAIEYVRGQGYTYETVRPRWKGGRVVVCKR